MYTLADHIIYSIDEETKKDYLMDIENGLIYNLNSTASMLIHFIQEQKTIEDYIQHVLELTEGTISQDQIEEDVKKYIDNLMTQGIVCEG